MLGGTQPFPGMGVPTGGALPGRLPPPFKKWVLLVQGWQRGCRGRDASPGAGGSGKLEKAACLDTTCLGVGPGSPAGQAAWGRKAQVSTAALCGSRSCLRWGAWARSVVKGLVR